MSSEDLPFFDIRTRASYNPDNVLSREDFEWAMDAIIRTTYLIGDMPFQSLFTLPLSHLSLKIMQRIYQAEASDLFQDADQIIAILQEWGDLTATTLTCEPDSCDASTLLETTAGVKRLRQLGILLPDFTEKRARKQLVLKNLLATSAAKLNYHAILDSSCPLMDGTAMLAIRMAIDDEVIVVASNGMCCGSDGKCRSSEDPRSFCALGIDGNCVPASNPYIIILPDEDESFEE